MAVFMFPNVAYRATAYRTGVFTSAMPKVDFVKIHRCVFPCECTKLLAAHLLFTKLMRLELSNTVMIRSTFYTFMAFKAVEGLGKWSLV